MLEADINYRVQGAAYGTHWATTRSPPNGYNDGYQNSGYDNVRDPYRPPSVHVSRTGSAASPFGFSSTPNGFSVATNSFQQVPRSDQQYPYSPPPSYGWPQSSYQSTPSYGAIGSNLPSYNNTNTNNNTNNNNNNNNNTNNNNSNSNAGTPNGCIGISNGRGNYRLEDEARARDVLASIMPMATDDSMDRPSHNRRRQSSFQSSFSPNGSGDDTMTESPSISDLSMDGNYEKSPPPMSNMQLGSCHEAYSGNGSFAAGLNDGSRSRPPRRGGNRDEFDGPHQLLPRPAPQYIAQQERELPHLPTHLHVEEQDAVLSQVNDRLSQCAFDFVARYQFPIPLTQDMRRVSRPQDREWTEWVQLLKRLATKRRIPARVLYNNQIKQFVTILENSLEMRHAARHQSRPLKDDRNILQLISAGIQVAKILKDAPAMDFLDRLYIDTEKQIQERSAAATRFRIL